MELLDPDNTSKDVWGDSAYHSEESLNELQAQGFREHFQRKGCRHKKLTARDKQGNNTRAKIRGRIEYLGVQAMRTGGTLLRPNGIVRIKAKK